MKGLFNKTWVCLCAILSLLPGGKAADKSTPKQPQTSKATMKNDCIHVNPEKGMQLIKTNPEVLVIDIRTPEEFASVRIPKARNIDFFDRRFQDEVAKINREQPILLHCASGNRSSKSLPIFTKLGFKKIYHLDGGINAWQKASNPVEK